MTKIARSISQRHGSADPDPYQNVMDPQHCLFPKLTGTVLNAVFGIRDVYPGSRILILPIPDPKTATEERSEKKFYLKPFYVATNFTKLKIIFVFKC